MGKKRTPHGQILGLGKRSRLAPHGLDMWASHEAISTDLYRIVLLKLVNEKTCSSLQDKAAQRSMLCVTTLGTFRVDLGTACHSPPSRSLAA